LFFAVLGILASLKEKDKGGKKIFVYKKPIKRYSHWALVLLYIVCFGSLALFLLEEITLLGLYIVIDESISVALRLIAYAFLTGFFAFSLILIGLCVEELRKAL
jgi:nitrate/nitrite transporter NarK